MDSEHTRALPGPIESVTALEPEVCVHRWQVTGPSGDDATGTCRLCGATRQFTNAKRGWSDRSAGQRTSPSSVPIPVRGS
jgi:hypothetical protein